MARDFCLHRCQSGAYSFSEGRYPSPRHAQKSSIMHMRLNHRLRDDVELFGGQDLNHILVNSYRPGEGILAHQACAHFRPLFDRMEAFWLSHALSKEHQQDGPAYFPCVAIVSLGASAAMHFRPPLEATASSSPGDSGLDRAPGVLLERRSLLVFSGDAYERWLHGIDAADRDVVGDVPGGCCAAPGSGICKGTVVEREGVRVSLTCRIVTKTLTNILPMRKT